MEADSTVPHTSVSLSSLNLASFKEHETYGVLAIIVISTFLTLGTLVSDTIASQVKLNPAKLGLTDFQLWTVITGSYVESNILKYLLFIGVVTVVGFFVEVTWTWRRFIPYVAVTGFLTCFASCTTKVVLFYTWDESYLFQDMYGLAGVLMSVLIALTQAQPETPIGIPGLKVRHLPLGFMVTYLAFQPLGLVSCADVYFVLYSFPFSVLYLQRIPPQTGNALTLDIFFPMALRPYIIAFGILIGRSQTTSDSSASAGSPAVQTRQLASDPVSERRRARALQALDRKLAEISNEPEISLDGDFESEA